MRANRMKRLIQEGKTVVGGWIATRDPYTVETLAGLGLDFLVVDTEHVPQTALSLQTNLIAIATSDTTPITRVLWNDFVRVKQALDLGSEGIIFPFVSTPDEARQAVAATRYPPEGVRGWGPRRAIRLASSPEDYFQHASDNLLVLPQVETQAALDHAAAIAAVDGVDGLLIGPADLSIALGVPFQLGSPTFLAAVRRVRAATDAAGKPFGVITSGAELARRWLDEGARIIIAGSDAALLAMMVTATVDEIRQAIGPAAT